MSENIQFQIDTEAAKALTYWKAQFANEVCENAKRIATQSNQPCTITLTHYRQAAEIALQSLSNAIHNGDIPDAERKVA